MYLKLTADCVNMRMRPGSIPASPLHGTETWAALQRRGSTTNVICEASCCTTNGFTSTEVAVSFKPKKPGLQAAEGLGLPTETACWRDNGRIHPQHFKGQWRREIVQTTQILCYGLHILRFSLTLMSKIHEIHIDFWHCYMCCFKTRCRVEYFKKIVQFFRPLGWQIFHVQYLTNALGSVGMLQLEARNLSTLTLQQFEEEKKKQRKKNKQGL